MGLLRDMYYGMKNKSLKVGTRFAVDSFQCTESELGKVTFKWEHPDGENAVYELEMLTDLHIPRITRSSYDLSMSGCLNYDDTQRDNVTGKEVTVNYKVKFRAEFEYQSDNNFHVVQFKRVPEKSETTKIWVFEMYNEGMMYVTGEGFPKDRDKAIEKFREAADNDHAGAKNMLEKFKDPNFCTLTADDFLNQGMAAYNTKDYAKAIELWRKAADMGNGWAMNNLGVCYRDGTGVPKDDAKKIEWYKKAAEQGHTGAMNGLAYCYKNGQGVPQDHAKAAELYEKATTQGDAAAMNGLGYCYLLGEGKPKDEKKAVELFRAAMDKGNVNAIDSLGECYRDGTGVKQDFAKAEELFNEAISKGNEASKASLAKLMEMKSKSGFLKKIFITVIILGVLGSVLYFARPYIMQVISSLTGKTDATQTTTVTTTATVTSNVNFRSGPSTDNAVIRQLQQGDTVTLTGETNGGWMQVSHNGETGWVSSEYLSK